MLFCTDLKSQQGLVFDGNVYNSVVSWNRNKKEYLDDFGGMELRFHFRNRTRLSLITQIGFTIGFDGYNSDYYKVMKDWNKPIDLFNNTSGYTFTFYLGPSIRFEKKLNKLFSFTFGSDFGFCSIERSMLWEIYYSKNPAIDGYNSALVSVYPNKNISSYGYYLSVFSQIVLYLPKKWVNADGLEKFGLAFGVYPLLKDGYTYSVYEFFPDTYLKPIKTNYEERKTYAGVTFGASMIAVFKPVYKPIKSKNLSII